ncbi:MAG: phage terminase large subunit [Christensenellaceae bacterium]
MMMLRRRKVFLNITPRGLHIDEADQVKHPNHITAWESTAVRFFQAHSKIIYAYNPPMSRSHWAHKFFGDKIKNGATKIYATWEDVRTLLNEKTIQTIEKFRRDDPEYYRYWYLGESVLFHGMVYPQFKREKHITNIYKLFAERDRVMELISVLMKEHATTAHALRL